MPLLCYVLQTHLISLQNFIVNYEKSSMTRDQELAYFKNKKGEKYLWADGVKNIS